MLTRISERKSQRGWTPCLSSATKTDGKSPKLMAAEQAGETISFFSLGMKKVGTIHLGKRANTIFVSHLGVNWTIQFFWKTHTMHV